MSKIDFRDFIFAAMAAKQKVRPGYSLRRFAADIGISAQKLNQVLKRKSGISPESAVQIAKRIGLQGRDHELFIVLVTAHHHRGKLVRQEALEKLKALQLQAEFDEISADEFNPISNWFYMAAAILVDIVDFQQDYDWIASRLGITRQLAEETYEKLFEIGWLYKDGNRWRRDSQKFIIKSSSSNDGLQKYYRDLMSVAEKTLTSEPVDSRHFSAAMVSVSVSDLNFIRESVDTFRRRLIHEISTRPGQAERVYGIGIQIFPVDKVNANQVEV